MPVKKTKLYKYLEALDKPSRRDFARVVKQRFRQPEEHAYLQLLILSMREDKELTRTQALAKIFGSEEKDDSKLRRLANRLMVELENWLAENELNRNPYLKSNLLHQAFRKHGMMDAMGRHLKKLSTVLEKEAIRDAEYRYSRFRLAQDKGAFVESQRDRTQEPNLQDAVDQLDLFYILTKLRLVCAMMNHSSVAATEYRYDLVNELVDKMGDGVALDPAVSTYLSVLEMIRNPEDESLYQSAKNSIQINAGTFSTEEARDLHLYAVNHCIQMVVRGKQQWLRELFAIYQSMLRNELVYDQGRMSPWTYKNIAAVAIRLEEFEWVKRFLSDYKDALEPRFVQTAFHYNQAYMHFARGRYREVLSALQRVEYQDLFYALDARALLLKSYFELDEYEALIALCESFRLYLLRHRELPSSRKENYRNLIQVVRQAARARRSHNKTDLNSLLEQIEDMAVSDKNWVKQAITRTAEEV